MTFTRDLLRHNYNTRQLWIEIQIEDVMNFNEDLADQIMRRPGEFILIVSLMDRRRRFISS